MSFEQHIFKGSTAPSTAPPIAGHHYINTTAGTIYLSKGATSPSDWVKVPTAPIDIGLGNVDNTSDANKPVSTATATALSGKANTIHTHVVADITDFSAGFSTEFATKSTSDLPEGTNLYYTATRFNSAFSGKSTTDLTEGTNLYFTNSRFNTVFATKTTTDLAEGTNLYYTSARFNSDFSGKSTTSLPEGTNLYYTQARFDTAFAAKSTTNLTEGTNLYYTSARFNTSFATKTTDDLTQGSTNKYYATSLFNTDFATKTTTNLTEGSNLYYTDVRAHAAFSGTSPITVTAGVIAINQSTTTQAGYLSSADWNTFNGKQDALTFGSISTSTTGVTVGSGANSTVGPSVTVNVQTASGSQPGLLSAADWTTFNNKLSSGNYITALTGDVTASGPGSAAATVALVGGSTASLVHSAELLANAATDANTASTIVKRDASGNFSSGAITITSSSINSLAVGPNGATNPIFKVDSSGSTAANGLSIIGTASGSGVTLQTISSGTDEDLTIASKGTGNLILNTNSATKVTLSNSYASFTPGVSTQVTTPRFSWTGAADLTLITATEAPSVYFNIGQTRQHATGDIALQRDFRINPATHSFVGASTITDATGLSVDGPPIGGTNATITNSHGIRIPGRALTNTTNSYGLTVVGSSGATNNYAAQFLSGNVGIGLSAPTATLHVSGTQTITSSSATALTVGLNGATNPALQIDASAATSVTGIKISSAASGGGVIIAAISSSAGENLTLNSLGGSGSGLSLSSGGTTSLTFAGTGRYTWTGAAATFSPTTSTNAGAVRFAFNAASDTSLTASTNAVLFKISGGTRSHATGAITLQEDALIVPSTHAFTGASTITDSVALALTPSIAGTNATITNAHGLYIPTSALTNTTNSYGITVAAASGATNNYAAQFTGITFITSTANNAFVVGANGLTNPAFLVDASTASVANGISVVPTASGSGVSLNVISSNANEGVNLRSKGSGNVNLVTANSTGTVNLSVNSTTRLSVAASFISFTPGASVTASTNRFSYAGAADVTLTAGAEAPSVYFNIGQTRQHSTGTITTQRDFRLTPTTHGFVGASALTDAMGMSIDGPPVGGTNATITNAHSLYIGSAAAANTTNSYGLTVNAAASGASNIYAAQFMGGNVGIGTATPSALLDINGKFNVNATGKVTLDATMTAGGTTGAQTINKPAGSVNFAATATSLTVTNSTVTASSIVVCVVMTNDSTATLKNVVVSSGSFVIQLTAAATAETKVGFIVYN